MADIEIFKKDESTVTIQCNSTISRELYNWFSVMATNYMFHPLYKSKMWDGKLHFFTISNNELAIGLIYKVAEFAKRGNYTVKTHFEKYNEISREDFQKFIETLNLPERIKIRPYQFESAYDACSKKNVNIHISTAGGKSLVIYIILRFLQLQNKKSLLIVPRVQLVEQMFSDFEEYGWDVERFCHRIYGGQKKFFDAPVIISCWQSLQNITDKKLFKIFDCIFIDEAQGGKGKELQTIAKSSTNADYRFGCSGTYPDPSTPDWYSIVGAFGPIKTYADYKHLQENNWIAQIKIYSMILNYNKDVKQNLYNEANNDYPLQNSMIYNLPERNDFIVKLTNTMKENCLILFNNKENHGYKLRDVLQEKLDDKIFVYIDGDVPISEREDIRKLISVNNNVILLATYGTLSAGINAPNLHNVIFASGTKSKVRTLQSIGRGLRLAEGKNYLKLYDLVDNCSYICRNTKVKFINYAVTHYKERLKYYKEQNWAVKEVEIKL